MAAKNTETSMQEVIDREAIRSLPLRYCHCVWQKDLDGYVNLFTDDGWLVRPPIPICRERRDARVCAR